MTKVKFLVTNDLHSRHVPFDGTAGQNVGGSARRASYFAKEAEGGEHILKLDVGDSFLGSNYFSFFHGEVEMRLLQHMGYSAAAVGNHDFDQGGLPNLLAQARKHAPDVALLCANIVHETSKEVVFKRFEVYSFEGVKVAVVGLIGKTAWFVTPAEYKEGLEYIGAVETAKEVVEEIQRAHQPALMVCLSHTGLDDGDDELARTGLFDVIFSGHQHYYEIMHWRKIKNGRENLLNGTLLHPGNWGGTAVAKVVAEFGRDGSLQSLAESTQKITAEFEPNSAVERILKEYDARMLPITSEVLGSCTSDSMTYEQHKGNLRSPLARFVSESLRCSFPSPPQIGVVNDGAIRNGIPKGEVTWGHINQVWPFEDKLLKVKVPGSLLQGLVELHVARVNSGRRGMTYHFSGLQVDYGISEPPDMKPCCLYINGEAVKETEVYTIAVTNYCFCNDWLQNIKGIGEQAVAVEHVDNIRDAIVQHVRSVSVIS